MKIVTINLDDPKYPELLRQITDPPKLLYCAGDVSLLDSLCVAVVGSRKCSGYGRWAAYAVSSRLASAGVTVVSGMARGIDTCAHKAALRAGGKTIAVLGTGLDITYPAANRELKNQIAREGLLVSEYPLGYPATKYTFPKRNRIISGMSAATVIAEAGNNSGSLITAGLAMEQGRGVYVIPANINNPNAIGGNMLMRDGAMPLVIIDDILDDLGIVGNSTDINIQGLGKDEKRIMELLASTSELSANELCDRLVMAPAKLNGLLTVLEMKGLIRSALGKIFLAK